MSNSRVDSISRARVAASELRAFFVLCGGLFIAFRWGIHLRVFDQVFETRMYDFYTDFQRDSDEWVIQRFVETQREGVFSYPLLLGDETGGYYLSQPGLWGWVLAMLPALLGMSKSAAVELMYSIVSASNAAIAASGLVALRKKTSAGAVALAAISLVQPFSVGIARSLYFSIGLKFLPAISLIYLLSRRGDSNRQLLLISFASCLATFLSGFDFLTTVVACQLSVLAYFATTRNWSLRKCLTRTTSCATGAVFGFLGAQVLLFTVLIDYHGSISQALENVLDTLNKRTGATGQDVIGTLVESLASSPVDVLRMYLSMPIFGAVSEGQPQITSYFRVDAFLVAGSLVALSSFRATSPATKEHQTSRGLALAWLVSTLGPLGWFLLARPYSYIHDHLCFSLWFLPTIPLGFALLWDPIRNGLCGLRSSLIATYWVVLVLVGLVTAFLYSALTVRP